jgi:FkbM family methyltransferase
VKKLLHSILGKLGYRIVRIEDGPRASHGLDPFFALLARMGFAPKHVLDVGANRGLWTREAVKFFPEARYTLVEPQDDLKVYIRDLVEGGSKIEWVNAGASDRAGTLAFTIAASDGSSTFVQTDRHGHATSGVQGKTVPVRTLDEIISASGAGIPEIVKIDAEGFDLKVLAGASSLLGRTDIFLVEAVVCGNYENLAARVIEFMAGAGYRLVDITDLNRSPKHGVLWLCELAFLRNGCGLFDGAASYE